MHANLPASSLGVTGSAATQFMVDYAAARRFTTAVACIAEPNACMHACMPGCTPLWFAHDSIACQQVW